MENSMGGRATRIVLTMVLLLVGYFVIGGLGEDEWVGFVYPNKNDLTTHQEIGAYLTLADCRSAALATIDAGGWRGNADYECGLNCRRGSLPMICEKTED